MAALTARDVVVQDVRDPIRLDDALFGPIVIEAEGFPDRVVWNPGSEHGLTDMAAGAEKDFVCIEPAALNSTHLQPGEQWSAELVLRTGRHNSG